MLIENNLPSQYSFHKQIETQTLFWPRVLYIPPEKSGLPSTDQREVDQQVTHQPNIFYKNI